jgi:hypothetical protein
MGGGSKFLRGKVMTLALNIAIFATIFLILVREKQKCKKLKSPII